MTRGEKEPLVFRDNDGSVTFTSTRHGVWVTGAGLRLLHSIRLEPSALRAWLETCDEEVEGE